MTDLRQAMGTVRDAMMEDDELYKALVASIASARKEWLFNHDFHDYRNMDEFIADRILGK